MIDIHCHILPGLDDGSKSIEESLEMARIAISEGISHIIATPHHANGKYHNEALTVLNATVLLNQELQRHKLPLQVLTGQEIRVYNNLISDYDSNMLLTLHISRYVLIEFPSHEIPKQMNELIHELRMFQLTPVIAHPERNRQIMDKPDRLLDLIQLGALSQVTAHSLNGLFGSKVQHLSLQLCRSNLVHYIASDAHNVNPRSFGLAQAYQKISQELGCEYRNYYMNNAYQLLEGVNQLEAWEPERYKKKWFQLLR